MTVNLHTHVFKDAHSAYIKIDVGTFLNINLLLIFIIKIMLLIKKYALEYV